MIHSAASRLSQNVWQNRTFLFALLAFPAAQFGCGRSTVEPAVPTSVTPAPAAVTGKATPAADFHVALVASGPTSDNGWNAGAAQALEAVQKELALPADNVKSVDNQTTKGDQEKSLRAFAAKKFNVIFAHGAEYESTALSLEKDFPNTLFVISSGRKVGANTMPIVFQLEDGAYLEGMLAASLSKTGKIGAVGAEEIVPLQSIFSAFEKGAKAVNPNIQVLKPVFTGSWDDANKAKQFTLGLLNQGADVIMQDVDSAAQGVFNAVQEYNKSGHTAYALGTNKDQNSAAPDVVVASAPIYSDKAFVEIAKAAQAGTLKASDKPFGMKEGIIGFVLNPALESKIPADIKTRLADTQKKITDGTFDVLKGGG